MFSKKISFLLLSMTIGIVVFIAQNKIPFFSENNNVSPVNSAVRTIDEVDLANFIILKKSPYTLCIDIREKQFYNYAHITGAVNIPSELILSGAPKELLNKSKKVSNIILYSNSNSNNLLQRAARKLSKLGINGVKVYSPGWEEWKACDLPMESNNE